MDELIEFTFEVHSYKHGTMTIIIHARDEQESQQLFDMWLSRNPVFHRARF